MSVVPKLEAGVAQPAADKLTRLLHRARDLTLKRINEAVKLMLDKVDDSLFELAEKADNTVTQRSYFDAMREVRLKRVPMETEFRERFAAEFELAIERKPLKPRGGTLGLGALGLVSDEVVEEDIAVSNMAEKISTSCREELFALDKRLGLLLRCPDLDGADNPIGPKAICNAIRCACALLESGIEVRLIVLKLFDRHVVATMQIVYHEVNQYLAEHKVLPEIRTTIRRAGPSIPGIAAAASSGAFGAAGAAGPTVAGAMTLDEAGALQMLQSLVSQGGAAVPAGYAAGGGVAGPMPTRVVGAVNALTQLQHGQFAVLGPGYGGIDPAVLHSGSTNVLRDLSGSAPFAALEGSERLTVDIVAMLFDYILADATLPDALKACIGRLQIPMVKVALLDRGFFSKKNHPARRLLNGIAEAAVARREEPLAMAALQAKVEALVSRVTNEFDDDVRLFAALVDEFDRFVRAEWHDATIKAERASKVVQGRERVEQAKIFARDAIERCVSRHGHHELIYNFLISHWKSLLITSHVECGADSTALDEALKTMDDLAWSVVTKPTQAERDKLTVMLPGLLKRLRRGLESISAPHMARQAFLAKLEKCHAQAVKSTAAFAPVAPAVELEAARVQVAARGIDVDLGFGADVTRPAFASDPNERTQPDPGAPVLDAAVGGADAAPWIDPNERTVPNPQNVLIVARGDATVDTGIDPPDRTLPNPEQALIAAAIELAEAVADPSEATLPEPHVPPGPESVAAVQPGPAAAPGAAASEFTRMGAPEPVTAQVPDSLPVIDPAIELEIDECELTLPESVDFEPRAPAVASAPEPQALAADAAALFADDAMPDEFAAEVPAIDVSLIDPGASSADLQVEDLSIEGGGAPSFNPSASCPDLGELMLAHLRTHGSVTVADLLAEGKAASPQEAPPQTAEPGGAIDFDTLYRMAQTSTDALDKLLADGALDIEELTIGDADDAADDADDPHVRAVNALEKGVWLEFKLEDGRAERGRLAWINSATDVFMFTDARGRKLLDRTRNGLVLDFRRGTAYRAGGAGEPLLDRAFSRLLDGLSTGSNV
jgi:hypothetical protein